MHHSFNFFLCSKLVALHGKEKYSDSAFGYTVMVMDHNDGNQECKSFTQRLYEERKQLQVLELWIESTKS